MSCVAASAFSEPFTPEAVIVDAARCWREAIDQGRSVLPTLFARLEARDAGFLAPAIAALLAVHEAWSGQRFRTGDRTAAAFTDDEQTLLGLLEAAAPPASAVPSRPGLTAPLRIALRSTRILVRRVLGQDLGNRKEECVAAADAPMFFASNDESVRTARRARHPSEAQDVA